MGCFVAEFSGSPKKTCFFFSWGRYFLRKRPHSKECPVCLVFLKYIETNYYKNIDIHTDVFRCPTCMKIYEFDKGGDPAERSLDIFHDRGVEV